jgi:uncharacterized membrane protein (DUF485 family)
MSNTDIDWHSVLESERFQRLARCRRNLVLVLGALAAAYYFAIPALIAWAPGWFRIRVTDGVNLGTLFAVSQYPFGALIAPDRRAGPRSPIARRIRSCGRACEGAMPCVLRLVSRPLPARWPPPSPHMRRPRPA